MQFDAYSPALRIPDLSDTGRREFARLLRSQDQRLVGLRADLGPRGFGPGADVDRLLDHLERAMEAAVGLEAPLLCLDVGPLPAPPAEVKPKPVITPDMAGLILLPNLPVAAMPEEPPVPPDPAFVSQVDGAMSELGRHADRYGVSVALRSDLAGFAAIHAVLRRANCQWLSIDLDPPAVLCDRWDADKIFSELGPLIRHVRGRDANVGAERRVKPAAIGRGNTTWPELLANLDAVDYRGWITVDPAELTDRAGAAAAGLAHLRAAG